jgi:hypothetical protein
MHEAVTRLQLQLREMIEADREQIVAYYAKWFKAGIEHFLKNRQPNLAPQEVYDRNKGEEQPIGIFEATTFAEAFEALGHKRYNNKVNRPAFEVTFKPNADEIINKLAAKEVEQMVLTFLGRATQKLGPLVERSPDYKMTRCGTQGGFSGGAWVGMIDFLFKDGVNFIATMKVITNFTKYGKPYGQYPMTFHEVRFGPMEEPVGMASIEELWAGVGYVPPPPQKRARWSKLVGGSVVIHEGKRVFISTPGVAKKLNVPQTADQIARIEANETWCHVEYADGTKGKHKYSEDELKLFSEAEGVYPNKNYAKGTEARRKFAYETFFPEETT